MSSRAIQSYGGKHQKLENGKSDVGNDQRVNNAFIYEILVKIFVCLDVVDVAVASLVCKDWNKACRDPSLWDKIDLSKLSSYCFTPLNKVGAYRHSSLKMTQFLKHVLNLSDGNTTYLIFNFYVYLTTEQFITVAQRTPKLKRVVLPETGDFTRSGVDTAMNLWRGLESITITSDVSGYFMLQAIGKYCNNITELKFFQGCNFEEIHAIAMIKCTPKLKLLSIRNVPTSMKALLYVLRFMEHLEKINICHSLIMDTDYPSIVDIDISDLREGLPSSILEKLIYCERGSCLRCKNGTDTTLSRQPDGPLEDIWGEDEIPSLAHLPQPSHPSKHARLLPFMSRVFYNCSTSFD